MITKKLILTMAEPRSSLVRLLSFNVLLIACLVVLILLFSSSEAHACRPTSYTSTTAFYPSCEVDERYNLDVHQPHYIWYKDQDVFQVVNTSPSTNSNKYSSNLLYDYFTVYPDLPEGLSLNPRTGIIFGTASQVTASKQYTVTSTNDHINPYWGSGQSIWVFTAEVVANNIPLQFGNSTIADQEWILGNDIRLELPLATGGIGEIKYTISHGLPNGFSVQDNYIVGRENESFSIHEYKQNFYGGNPYCRFVDNARKCDEIPFSSVGTGIHEIGTVQKRYRYAPLQSVLFQIENHTGSIDYTDLPNTVPDRDTILRNYNQFHSIVDTNFFWYFDEQYTRTQYRNFYRNNEQRLGYLYSGKCPSIYYQNPYDYNHGELYVNYCMLNFHQFSSNSRLSSWIYNNKQYKEKHYSDFKADTRRNNINHRLKSFILNHSYEYYWIATDEMGRTAVRKFKVTLRPAITNLPEKEFQFQIEPQIWTEGGDVTLELPELNDPDDNQVYSLSPELPPGLQIIDNQIVGTMTHYPFYAIVGNDRKYPRFYNWTTRKSDGQVVSLQFEVSYIGQPPQQIEYEVNELWNISEKTNVPLFRRRNLGSFRWQIGQKVHQPLPVAWNGGQRPYYRISENLPAGLLFDSVNSIIYGTPTELSERAIYLLRASACSHPTERVISHCSTEYSTTSKNNQFQFSGTDNAIFSLEIISNNVTLDGPSFGEQTVEDQQWSLGNNLNMDLPEATGGQGQLKYYLSHSLPAGLRVNQNRIEGSLDINKNNRIFDISLEQIPNIPENLTFRIVKKYIYSPWKWFQEDIKSNFSQQPYTTTELAERITNKQTIVGLEVFLMDKTEGRVLFHNIDPQFDYRTVFELVNIDYSDYLLPGEELEYVNLNDPIMWWNAEGIPSNHRNQINLHNHDFWLEQEFTYIWTVVDEANNIDQISFQLDIQPGNFPIFSAEPIRSFESWKDVTRSDGSVHTNIFGHFMSFDLPEARGGEGTISYRIEPNLFGGLEFDGQDTISGIITGEQTSKRHIPTGEFITDTYRSINIDEWDSYKEKYNLYAWRIRNIENRPDIVYPIVSFLDLFRMDKFYLIAEDEQGNQNSLPFYLIIYPPISVDDGNLPPVEDVELTVGEQIKVDLAPVEWISETFCYKISPELPEGLTFVNGSITGTPTQEIESTTYTYSAHQISYNTINTEQICQQRSLQLGEPEFVQEFELSVVGITSELPNFRRETLEDQTWKVEETYSIDLPSAIGGDAPLSYSLSPALPAGVTLTGNTVGGSPTAVLEETDYVWKVTDTDGDTASLVFKITVLEDLKPSFGTETVMGQVWRQGDPVWLGLPNATGGDRPLSYNLSHALPAGIRRVGNTIAGIPTTLHTETSFIWTVTDSDGDTVSLTFSVSVVPDLSPDFGTNTIADQTWTQNQPVSELYLPAAIGGDGILSYNISPPLPDGLTVTSQTISGTPTIDISETSYTWIATDSDGDSAVLNFNITILPDLEPTFEDNVIIFISWVRDHSITDLTLNTPESLTLPDATGGDLPLSYELTPQLPAGITLNGTTFEGIPTETVNSIEYTWTATDVDGDQAEFRFRIHVDKDRKPGIIARRSTDLHWELNQPANFRLATSVGGNGNSTYTLTPDLPTGLNINHSRNYGFGYHTITGTTSNIAGLTQHRLTVTDKDGDTAVLDFGIRIGPGTIPSTSHFTQNWRVGDDIWILFGGTAESQEGWTYSFQAQDRLGNPDPNQTIPTFLNNDNNRILTGTPTSTDLPNNSSISGRIHWTATDPQGAIQRSQTLTWTLHPDQIPTFPIKPIQTFIWTRGEPLPSYPNPPITLPTATGGDQPLTYQLTPEPPSGIWIPYHHTFHYHSFIGTPSRVDRLTPQIYTWTATDSDQNPDTASTQIRIQIVPDLTPYFQPNHDTQNNFTIGHTYTNTYLHPQAHGGNTERNTQTYTIDPPLPTGLTLIPTNGTITGTPSGPPQTTTHTWTYTDSDNTNPETIQTTITIEIQHPQTSQTVQPTSTQTTIQTNSQTATQEPVPQTSTPPTTTIIQQLPTTLTTSIPQTPSTRSNTTEPTPPTPIQPDSTSTLPINQSPTTQTTTQNPVSPTNTSPTTTVHTQTTQPTTQPTTASAHTPITQQPISTLAETSPPNLTQATTQNPVSPTNTSPIPTIPNQPAPTTNTPPPTQPTTPPSHREPHAQNGSTQNEYTPTTNQLFRSAETDNTSPATPTPQFTDTQQNPHQHHIQQLAQQGITQGCNPPHNTNYCPNRTVTRAEIATLLTRTLNLTPTHHNYFTDIADNTHQANINTLAHHQITQSCNPPHNNHYCPNRTVTRAEIATLLTRAFNLTPTKINYFADIAGNTHQANINTLAHHQITQGCHYQDKIHNSRYCPNRPITRAELATLLIKTQQHQQTGSP